MEDVVNPVAALQTAGAEVVNCAVVAVVVPDGHVALTLQSYNDDAASPVRLAFVVVWAVEKLVQVDEELSL